MTNPAISRSEPLDALITQGDNRPVLRLLRRVDHSAMLDLSAGVYETTITVGALKSIATEPSAGAAAVP